MPERIDLAAFLAATGISRSTFYKKVRVPHVATFDIREGSLTGTLSFDAQLVEANKHIIVGEIATERASRAERLGCHARPGALAPWLRTRKGRAKPAENRSPSDA